MPAPPTERRRTVTRDEVIAAARDILDEEGLPGLTMANVAARVGFTTMAVYRHVKNRDDLIAGTVELVLGEIRHEEAADVDWLDGVEAWMHDVRGCLLRHPWAATQLGSREGGSSVPWANALQILGRHITGSGMSARDQARAFAWITRLTIGVLIIEIGAPLRRDRERRSRRRADSGLGEALSSLHDDDLWSDAVAQTRSFLASMAAG